MSQIILQRNREFVHTDHKCILIDTFDLQNENLPKTMKAKKGKILFNP